MQCKSLKDGQVGWATLTDPVGQVGFELAKLMVCTTSIAITTTFDIGDGKAIRKLDVGEHLEIIDGPREDPKRSLLRVNARTVRDSQEGWVTMQGNQGTVYGEEVNNHYVAQRSAQLEREIATGSGLVRKVEAGEVFQLVDGPQTLTQ